MQSFVVGALEKLKKSTLWYLLLAPLVACAADSSSVSMEPYTVDSTAGAQLKVAPLDRFDSPWAMTFLPDQSLLVTQKGEALWLLELAWQPTVDGDADWRNTGLIGGLSSRALVRVTLQMPASP